MPCLYIYNEEEEGACLEETCCYNSSEHLVMLIITLLNIIWSIMQNYNVWSEQTRSNHTNVNTFYPDMVSMVFCYKRSNQNWCCWRIPTKNVLWKLRFNCCREIIMAGAVLDGKMRSRMSRMRLWANKNSSSAEFYEIQFSCSSNSSKYGEIKLIICTKRILIMVLIRLEVN